MVYPQSFNTHIMRTLHNYQHPPAVEMASKMPSQIEPDGATDIRTLVKQYMSGVPVHQPQQVYFDFDAAIGGIPSLDDLPQIPNLDTIEAVDDYFRTLKAAKAGGNPPVDTPPPPPPSPSPDSPPKPPSLD